MMSDAIKNFPAQFAYRPEVVNKKKLKAAKKFVVVGMGGSHLAADLLKLIDPKIDLVIHSDYGLPEMDYKNCLVILSSYSGNTEETLDAYKLAKKKKIAMATVAVGGKLLDWAKKDQIAYVQLPNTGIQPRSALGFSLLALFALVNRESLLLKARAGIKMLNVKELSKQGEDLADKLINFVPIIYSSAKNYSLAYNWKIKFNETGKIPAFCNQLPELNHNEMTGFDVQDSTKSLSTNFCFIFLKDTTDDKRIIKRMEVMKELYEARGLKVEMVDLLNKNIFVKIFQSLLLADWIAVKIAEKNGLESEQVPMVEDFKKMLA